MILSLETLDYQWIIAEVSHSDEEFAHSTCSSCITLVCVACVFDIHRFGENKLVSQNDILRSVHFFDTAAHPRVLFTIKQLSTKLNRFILGKITILKLARMDQHRPIT